MRRPVTFWSLFGVLVLGSLLLFANINVRTDSSFLLPRFASPDLRLVTEQLRRGPASNILLIGLSGGSKEMLTLVSDRLTGGLRANSAFSFVANGRPVLDPAAIAWARTYRYLLNPPVAKDEFSPSSLSRAFNELLTSLGTSTGLFGEDLLFADPTGRMLRILAYFSQQDAPKFQSGIWISSDVALATIVARPRSDPLDLDGQAMAIAQVRSAFQEVLRKLSADGSSEAKPKLLVSGPGVFAVNVREQVVSELSWIGMLALGCSITLVWIAFRSFSVLALLSFAVGVGLAAGVLAVRLVFGEVHGVTITFGMMLTGLAIDYPIHVLVHGGQGGNIERNLKPIWRTLHLSVLTTVAAFVPFTASSFPGLAQLGVVSIVGISATYLVTRLLLPQLLGTDLLAKMPLQRADWRRPSHRTARRIQASGAILVVAIFVCLALGSGKIWEDNLANLSPLSRAQLETDLQLRKSVQAINPRFLLVIDGFDREIVLERVEAVCGYLDQLVTQKRLAGFDAPSRYLPSRKTQLDRRAGLPSGDELRARVAAALASTPFQESAFDQFISDVERSRSDEALLTHDAAASSLFGVRLSTLLFRRDNGWAGLILFQGESIPFGEIAESTAVVSANGKLYDLKAQADGLLESYRSEAVIWLGLGALASLGVLVIGLRNAGLVMRAFVPVALAVALTAAVILLLGISLSLFHLMALSVVAGLGYDYALFLDRLRDQEALDRATIHAVILCALTTICSYAFLSLSKLPILNGIGLTVAIGCVLVLALAGLFSIGAKREGK